MWQSHEPSPRTEREGTPGSSGGGGTVASGFILKESGPAGPGFKSRYSLLAVGPGALFRGSVLPSHQSNKENKCLLQRVL